MRRLIVISGLVLFAPGVGVAQDAPPRYSVKRDDAPTGSNIRRDAASSHSIPLDKKYGELTADEQAYLKRQYEAMGAADEPPFPAEGLRPIMKAIDSAQRKLLVRGPLSMFVDIDSKGEPLSVSVYESPDPKMTKFVASVLMVQKYKPAFCKGQPCRMSFPFRMTFNVGP